jgi:hypothetical protein
MGKTRKREKTEGERFIKKLVCDTCGIAIDFESAHYNNYGDLLCYKCKQLQEAEEEREFINEFRLDEEDY